MSWIVKVGKQGKKIVKKLITPAEKHYVGYTRRIERVHTTRRICAMTFDDGPMGLPASPDRFDGRTLTDVLLDTLAQYGARGSFDVIGDTSANYPDEAGKLGSAAWGGVRFDHYPDIHCDEQGGAEHNDRLIRRMLAEGHQITNHGYRHIIFGKKPFVYGAREYLPGFDAAVEDLTRLHTLMQTRYGYTMTLARPPHYVDKMTGGFTSYDVYDHMGYQYMAASFDGAGWLPSTDPDPEAALQAEIRAMVEPMRKALEKDPDFFCGRHRHERRRARVTDGKVQLRARRKIRLATRQLRRLRQVDAPDRAHRIRQQRHAPRAPVRLRARRARRLRVRDLRPEKLHMAHLISCVTE